MIDTTDLIGKPFEYHGRGPDSYDCWGLVKECYQRWHGVELPDYPSTPSPLSNDKEMRRAAQSPVWKPVERMQAGSLVMLRVRGFGSHVGFALTPTRMIHTLSNVNAVIVRAQTFKNQIIGSYLYVG